MKSKNPIAAIVLLTIGALLTLLMLRSPAVTYAEVIKKIGDAHIVRFDEEFSGGGIARSRMTVIISDQGIEYIHGEDYTTIVEYTPGERNIYLVPKQQFAHVFIGPSPDVKVGTILDEFKRMMAKPSKDLGPDQIDGHSTEKFLVEQKEYEERARPNASADEAGPLANMQWEMGNKMAWHADLLSKTTTIWADAKTHDPVRVEEVIGDGPQAKKTVFTNFALNPVLTADEVSTEIPNNYTQEICGCSLMSPAELEKAVVQSLGNYAAQHGGDFPPDISAFPADMVFTGKQSDMRRAASPSSTQSAISTGSADPQTMMVTITAPDNNASTAPGTIVIQSGDDLGSKVVWAWEYYTGKKANDKSALIFWLKAGDHYRGVYGDLSVKDIAHPPSN